MMKSIRKKPRKCFALLLIVMMCFSMLPTMPKLAMAEVQTAGLEPQGGALIKLDAEMKAFAESDATHATALTQLVANDVIDLEVCISQLPAGYKPVSIAIYPENDQWDSVNNMYPNAIYFTGGEEVTFSQLPNNRISINDLTLAVKHQMANFTPGRYKFSVDFFKEGAEELYLSCSTTVFQINDNVTNSMNLSASTLTTPGGVVNTPTSLNLLLKGKDANQNTNFTIPTGSSIEIKAQNLSFLNSVLQTPLPFNIESTNYRCKLIAREDIAVTSAGLAISISNVTPSRENIQATVFLDGALTGYKQFPNLVFQAEPQINYASELELVQNGSPLAADAVLAVNEQGEFVNGPVTATFTLTDENGPAITNCAGRGVIFNTSGVNTCFLNDAFSNTALLNGQGKATISFTKAGSFSTVKNAISSNITAGLSINNKLINASQPISFKFNTNVTIKGKVLNANTNQPMANVPVSAYFYNNRGSADMNKDVVGGDHVQTDADGNFVFELSAYHYQYLKRQANSDLLYRLQVKGNRDVKESPLADFAPKSIHEGDTLVDQDLKTERILTIESNLKFQGNHEPLVAKEQYELTLVDEDDKPIEGLIYDIKYNTHFISERALAQYAGDLRLHFNVRLTGEEWDVPLEKAFPEQHLKIEKTLLNSGWVLHTPSNQYHKGTTFAVYNSEGNLLRKYNVNVDEYKTYHWSAKELTEAKPIYILNVNQDRELLVPSNIDVNNTDLFHDYLFGDGNYEFKKIVPTQGEFVQFDSTLGDSLQDFKNVHMSLLRVDGDKATIRLSFDANTGLASILKTLKFKLSDDLSISEELLDLFVKASDQSFLAKDGLECLDYDPTTRVLTVTVGDQFWQCFKPKANMINLVVKVEDVDKLHTIAVEGYNANNQLICPIGHLDFTTNDKLTISGPNETTGMLNLGGLAMADADVELFCNGTSTGIIAKANKKGNWQKTIDVKKELPNVQPDSELQFYVKSNNQYSNVHKVMLAKQNTVQVLKITDLADDVCLMDNRAVVKTDANGKQYTTYVDEMIKKAPITRYWVPGKGFKLLVTTNNDEEVAFMKVCIGNKLSPNNPYTTIAEYDASKKAWVAKGIQPAGDFSPDRIFVKVYEKYRVDMTSFNLLEQELKDSKTYLENVELQLPDTDTATTEDQANEMMAAYAKKLDAAVISALPTVYRNAELEEILTGDENSVRIKATLSENGNQASCEIGKETISKAVVDQAFAAANENEIQKSGNINAFSVKQLP